MKIILTTSDLKRISVERYRQSATQAYATICVDGKPVEYYNRTTGEPCHLDFWDEMYIESNGLQSRSKDIDFIKAVLHHPYDYIYHFRDQVLKALGYEE